MCEVAQERICTPEYVERLWSLLNHLYEDLKQYAGGPLHIVVDDYNVEDSSLKFCRDRLHEEDDEPVRNVSAVILDMLEPLTLADRGGIVCGPIRATFSTCSEEGHRDRKALGHFCRRFSEHGGADYQGCFECLQRAATDASFAFKDTVATGFDEEGKRLYRASSRPTLDTQK